MSIKKVYKQKEPKKTITLRLSPEVIKNLKSIKNYNVLVDDLLRDYFKKN